MHIGLCTRLEIWTKTPQLKAVRLKRNGSKVQYDKGRMWDGSKDGSQCESGENDLEKVMFFSFSSRTFQASRPGGINFSINW